MAAGQGTKSNDSIVFFYVLTLTHFSLNVLYENVLFTWCNYVALKGFDICRILIKLIALCVSPTQKVCGAYVYLLFMIVALVAFTFTWIRLPETKGRTFDDIAELFRGADEIPLHNKMGFNTFT